MRGRPRDQHINVRVTPEERAAIMTRSTAFGMAPSTFMRQSAMLREEKPVRVADADELTAMRTDLKRIGNLLNQCTRALHTHGPDDATLPLLRGATANVSDAALGISRLLAETEERRRL